MTTERTPARRLMTIAVGIRARAEHLELQMQQLQWEADQLEKEGRELEGENDA